MTDRPPPFSALRAVEAASRHRSFTWAAKELQITHSAVSQSIRRLEADLGTTLFQRKGGAMEPSEAAMRLAETYSEAAQALGRTLREVTGSPLGSPLAVVMPADFGRLWFSGKMARLTEAMPDLSIVVRTGAADSDADLAIEMTALDDPGPGETITEILSFPVCSPQFAASRELSRPADLARLPLISGGGLSWDRWSGHFEVRMARASGAHVFDEAGMALDAAVQGGGVALSHLFAAESYLQSGRLVALPMDAPTGTQLILGAKRPGLKTDMISRFSMWLKLEVGRSLALHAARKSTSGGG
jgi:LysR family glycine cleavage system transcriptional activator